MREPYFKVGEEVIRKGKHYPETDGEYVVTEVITAEEYKHLYPRVVCSGGYFYEMKGFSVEITYVYDGSKTGEISYHTHEANFRKKYPPSSEGFHDMMQKIKDNVLEGVE